ncbi:TetR/AcrR family transcriptional regulator [Pseudoruegeria sp. HB172150]|uniref:TetR/AcrR family transcriptional regulator n=1 Tax=Pseudoruegeria sp. HB172150 TaxID=2721164 RepID=UPI0015578BEE|nr:TetR/AcrR family transcriptional regulator [Pseudoruegeria sp. HB172150]
MGAEPQKSSRKPRADSIRNREKLLAAASDVFSAGGPGASLEAVAREAGVGIGTLYRHFPTRESLFLAVYEREVDEMVDLATRLAGEADPVEALRRWMHASVHMVATKRGMLAALTPTVEGADAFFAEVSKRLLKAVSDLMDRGIETGRLRGDVPPEEVMRAFLAICYTREQPGWQETVIRLLDVFIDGLATSPAQRDGGAG